MIQEAQDSFEQRRAALLDQAFRGELTRTWREQHPDTEPADRLLERIREEKASYGDPEGGPSQKGRQPLPIDPPYELPRGESGSSWGSSRVRSMATSAKANIIPTGVPVLEWEISGWISQSDNLRYLPPGSLRCTVDISWIGVENIAF